MTKATMPELIWAHVDDDGFTDYTNMKGWKENGIESPYEGAEYIRADLVPAQSSVDAPLEEGQWRWVRHGDTPGVLDIARVSVDEDGTWMNATVVDAYYAPAQSPDQYVYIGPVIQPPED